MPSGDCIPVAAGRIQVPGRASGKRFRYGQKDEGRKEEHFHREIESKSGCICKVIQCAFALVLNLRSTDGRTQSGELRNGLVLEALLRTRNLSVRRSKR